MTPNFTSIHKVLGRIEEISRKYNTPFGSQSSPVETPKNRFVELLDAEQKKRQDTAVPGRQTSASIGELRNTISRAARDYNVDEELIRAVIQVESGWKSDAVSSKGAQGLMQLMPRTAAMLGVEDAFDPQQNIEGGVKYLAQLTDKYEGRNRAIC